MNHTGSWVWDVGRGRPVYWSDEMCRIHGRDAAQGAPSFEEYRALLLPEDWSLWLASLEKSLRQRTSIDLRCRLALSDGLVRHIRIMGRPIAGTADKITEIIGSTAEIGGERHDAFAQDYAPEDPFRRAIDLIPALAWSSRPDGAVDLFSQGWLDYTGFTVEQAAGWGWTAAIHPDDLDSLMVHWRSFLPLGEQAETEARLRRSDGEYRWFLIRTRPQRDESGNVVRWYGTNTDIEDRRRAEDKLRDSEGKFRLLVETIPALIWRGTVQGELDYLNQRHIDYLGKTAESLSGGRWMDLVHPDHRDSVVRRWLDSAGTGVPYEDVYRIRRADGQYRWIQSVGAPFYDAEGQISQWYGMLTDIDDRKRAEDALRESEGELRQIVESVPGMIAVADSRGQHEYANKRALDYTGTTLEESRGLGFIDTIHPDEQDYVRNEWLRCNRLVQPMDLNHRWRRFDGEYRLFHVRVEPRMDDQGKVVRWYGLLTDIEDRTRAEEALRESERLLRILVETIPALLWRATAEGEIDYVNQRVLEYTGLSPVELRRSGWSSVLHPDDVDQAVQKWRDDVHSGSSHDVTCRLRSTGGEYRWFQARGEPLRDNEGKVVGWYGVLFDIDDRIRAEQGIQDSEAALREFFEAIPALVWRSTPRGDLDYANQRCLAYIGYNAERSAGGGWTEYLHPDHAERAMRRWRHSTDTGTSYEDFYLLRRADGVYRWIQTVAEPVYDKEGRIRRWYGFFIDIDDRKRAEQAVQENEQRLRLIIDTIPALVWRATAEGEPDYLNQRLITYTGKRLDDFGRLLWTDLVHPEDRETTTTSWFNAVGSGVSFDVKCRLRGADGSYRWFQSTAAPLRDDTGQIVHWFALVIDIDDSKQTEEALKSAQKRLSAAMQIATVAELSASIAHEINQPLAAVVANGHACRTWLSGDAPNLERARLAAERIVRDGNLAAEVVSRIRALFRQADPTLASLDINEVVLEVLRLLEEEIRDIIVHTDLTPDLPAVPADRIQMQQTLINLVHNAVEAMTGVTDRSKTLLLVSRREGDTVIVQVRDSGCGVADTVSIFDPFFTTKGKGMGMGLSICRSIVEAHGGRLWATPNEDVGMTFSFTLPVGAIPSE